MKYILIIGAGAVVIAVLLAVCVDYFFGGWVSSFFEIFIALPVGLGVSFFVFMFYDTQYLKEKKLAPEIQDKNNSV